MDLSKRGTIQSSSLHFTIEAPPTPTPLKDEIENNNSNRNYNRVIIIISIIVIFLGFVGYIISHSCQDGEYKTNVFGIFSRCNNITQCNSLEEYEVSAPNLTSDRECKPITQCTEDEYEYQSPTFTANRICKKCAEVIYTDAMSICAHYNSARKNTKKLITDGNFEELENFLNKKEGEMKNFLFSIVPDIVQTTLDSQSSLVYSRLQERNNDALVWSSKYLENNLKSSSKELSYQLYSRNCLMEMEKLLNKVALFFAHQFNKIDEFNNVTKSKMISQADFNSITNSLELMKERKEEIAKFKENINYLPMKIPHIHIFDEVVPLITSTLKNLVSQPVDLMHSKTMINKESRKEYFNNLFSEFDSLLKLEESLGNFNGEVQKGINSFIENIKNLKDKAKAILNIPEPVRSNATAFNTIDFNLQEISHLCSRYQKFNCFSNITYSLHEKIMENAEYRIRLAKISGENLSTFSSSLAFVQLMSTFSSNPVVTKNVKMIISDFLDNCVPIESSQHLHDLLQIEPEGLGEQLIEEQRYFDEIKIRIRAARANKNVNDLISELREAEGTNNNGGWLLSNIFKWKGDNLLNYYHEYERYYKSVINITEVYYKVQSREEYNTRRSSIFRELTAHIAKECIVTRDKGTFNKACLPKAIAYLSVYWGISRIENETKYPVKTLIIQPFNAQIIAISLLLGYDQKQNEVVSHLAQVRTGEGKSLILALISSFLALLGHDVHIVCYSPYLTQRDKEDFSAFYNNLGVNEKIHYQTLDELTEYVVNIGVSVRDYVEKGNIGVQKSKEEVSKILENSFLLIDEADVFFDERFFGNTYNIGASIQDKYFRDLAIKIWNDKVTNFDQILRSDEYKNTIRSLRTIPEKIIISAVEKMIFDLKNMEGHFYVAKDGKIGYPDIDYINFNQFYPYKTLLAYMIEQSKDPKAFNITEEVSALRLSCGSFSYAEIPTYFKAVLGVSGTLEDLHYKEKLILKDRYNIEKITVVPSMFAKSKMDFEELNGKHVIVVDESSYKLELLQQIIHGLKLNQKGSVIVVFKDTKSLLDFYDSSQFAEHRFQTKFFTEESDEEDRRKMTTRTTAGQITFITAPFGRGTDFSCYDIAVNQNGGVRVIQTFFSKDPKEEVQVRGRAGRAGAPGSFRLVLKESDLIGEFGLDPTKVNECKRAGNCYHLLAEQRGKAYSDGCETKKLLADNLLEINKKSFNFLDSIYLQDFNAINQHLVDFNSYQLETIELKKGNPSYYVLALDASGSMHYDSRYPWNQLVEGVKYLLASALRKNRVDDRFTFIIYDHQVERVVENKSAEEALDLINTILQFCGGGTEFGEAITQAHSILINVDQTKFDMKFLFLTDGFASSGMQEIKKLGDDLGPRGLKTIFCGFSRNANLVQLNNMAAQHGHGAVVQDSDLSKLYVEKGIEVSVIKVMENLLNL